MKNLAEFLKESMVVEASKETYFEIDSDEYGWDQVLTIADERGNLMEFDPKEIEKILKKNGNSIRDQKFIEAIFDAFPDADTINIERSGNNDEPEPVEYVHRSEIKKGWQKA